MATLTIDGKEITLPRYSINIMAVAGPFMDEIFAVATDETLSRFTDLNRLIGSLTGFIAAGAVKVDPTLTQERLGDVFSMADAPILQKVVEDVFAELGVDMKGNPLAPAAPAAQAEPVEAIPAAAPADDAALAPVAA